MFRRLELQYNYLHRYMALFSDDDISTLTALHAAQRSASFGSFVLCYEEHVVLYNIPTLTLRFTYRSQHKVKTTIYIYIYILRVLKVRSALEIIIQSSVRLVPSRLLTCYLIYNEVIYFNYLVILLIYMVADIGKQFTALHSLIYYLRSLYRR